MNRFLAFDATVFQNLQVSTFLILAVAMISGMLITRVMKVLTFPNVTGYLIVGIILGPSVLNILDKTSLQNFEVITSLALGFIAFSIGGEFKLSHLKSIGGKIMIIATVQAVCASIFVISALFLVQAIKPELAPTPVILILCSIAAATAPAATLMVVRQYKAKGPVTDTLLPVVAFDDAIALMIFSVCLALARVFATGQSLTVLSAFVYPMLEIVLSLGIGTVLGIILGFICRFFHSRTNRLIWMITIVVLAVAVSEMFELSSLLTCMMLGAAFTNSRHDSIEILDGMERWTPVVFMLFFIISGAGLDLKVVPYIGVVGVVYIFARTLGKWFGAWGSSKLLGSPKTVQKYLGITLLPQGGVEIGMALTIAKMPELSAYSDRIVTVVLCATLIYLLIGPVFTKFALKKAGEIDEGEQSYIKQLFDKIKNKNKPVSETSAGSIGAEVITNVTDNKKEH